MIKIETSRNIQQQELYIIYYISEVINLRYIFPAYIKRIYLGVGPSVFNNSIRAFSIIHLNKELNMLQIIYV